MICQECGHKMKENIIRKGGNFRSKIIRYECFCGFQTAGESIMERLENDALDKKVKEKIKLEKKGFNEPFI